MDLQQQLQQLNKQLLLLVTLCTPFFVLLALALAQYFSATQPILPFLQDPEMLKIVLVIGVSVAVFEAVCIVQNMRKRTQIMQKMKAEQTPSS